MTVSMWKLAKIKRLANKGFFIRNDYLEKVVFFDDKKWSFLLVDCVEGVKIYKLVDVRIIHEDFIEHSEPKAVGLTN